MSVKEGRYYCRDCHAEQDNGSCVNAKFGRPPLMLASYAQIVKPDASGDPDALEKGEAKAAPASARPIQRDDTAHGSLAARSAMTKAPEE